MAHRTLRPAFVSGPMVLFAVAGAAWGNVPPDAPVITEPASEGQIVNPSDVHMETAPFSDPDNGDTHLCTDWEIWRVNPSERVWAGLCVTGLEKVHAHFGDGNFMGSSAGQDALEPDTEYRLRVRHRDDSGQAGTEWSAWSERGFRTAPPTEILPLTGDDILDSPTPRWIDSFGADLVLPPPPPPGTFPPSLRIEQAGGAVLLEFRGHDGLTNQLMNPGILPGHEPIRVVLSAGDEPSVAFPESELRFTDHEGDDITIYLPAMGASGSTEAIFWVSAAGASYFGQSGQTAPSFANPARSAPTPWIATRPGYKVDTVASGLRLPVNIAFVPESRLGDDPDDPFYYVTELYGTIKVVTRSGQVRDYAAGLLNFNPTGQFPGSGEQGLSGIVVHEATGDVFAGMLYDAGGPHYPKVVRFTSNDGGLTAATQTTILNMIGESQGQSHQISNMTFGPDGLLYVHMGDGFNAGTGQNLNSFRGKILRMNLNGTAPADNPFYNAGDGISARDYVFAYGLRNPFGGAWRASDGQHYMVENGPSVDRIARVVRSRNYLWDGSDNSMQAFAAYNWVPSSGPVNCVFVQPQTFDGSGFPAEMMDKMIVTESGATWATGPQSIGKRLTVWQLDAGGNLINGGETLVQYVGSGKATAVGLAAGPDGIYFTDLYKDQDYTSPVDRGANVLRVKFVGAADFAADVRQGLAPMTVSFTDTSTVPNPTAWLWSFGDGTVSTQQHPTHTYLADGVYDVRLTVTGADGVSVELKPGYIRVGDFSRIALIGAGDPPVPGDAAVADALRAQGFEVDTFAENPASRPTPAQMAADYDLIVVSSTIASGNVAGQFSNLPVPLIDWEHAIMRPDREPLASNGAVANNQTTISIINNNHPITAHNSLGVMTVFESPANMSFIQGPFGPGVQVLATRTGVPTDAVIAAAEQGAALLNGRTAPARRVFLFFEDSSFMVATHDAEHVLEHAACWAMGLTEPGIASQSGDTVVRVGGTLELAVGAQGAGPMRYQWRLEGSTISGAVARELVVENFGPGDAGVYDVLVQGPCGQTTSAPIEVTATCEADLDLNLVADVFDLLAYLDLWFAADAGAEMTDDAAVDVFDLLAYLDLWFPASADGCTP